MHGLTNHHAQFPQDWTTQFSGLWHWKKHRRIKPLTPKWQLRVWLEYRISVLSRIKQKKLPLSKLGVTVPLGQRPILRDYRHLRYLLGKHCRDKAHRRTFPPVQKSGTIRG
jgi:hypothetical protein